MAMKFVRKEYDKGVKVDGSVVVGYRGKDDENVSYILLTDSPDSCKFLNQKSVLPIVTSIGRVKLQKTRKGLEPSIDSIEIYSDSELKEMVEETVKKTRGRFEKEGRLEDFRINEAMLRQDLYEAYKAFNMAFGKQSNESK
jgi:hypothetical protein